MKATDLSIGDIGKTFRSLVYPNNNKTARPSASFVRFGPGDPGRYVIAAREWTLTELYAHKNGNIKINNSYHLRADTKLEEVPNDPA